MNTKNILYYSDLICEKIDLQLDACVKRIEALYKGDTQTAEFIEKMMIEPLEKQISFLANKAMTAIRKGKDGQ